MDRFCLTDARWARMQPFCLGKPFDPGRTGGDARLFAEAVPWVARTGSPWRNLPPLLGNGGSVFKRYCGWVKGGSSICSRLCLVTPKWNTRWLTLRSSGFTAKVKAQKGGREIRPPASRGAA